MKVYYCNSSLESCYYVRCLIPMREAGWDGDRTSLRTDRIAPEMQAKAVLDADVVVFHRPNDDRSLKIAEHLRAQGKKIVMDNDDTYKGMDKMRLGKVFKQIDKAVDDFGKFADLITCSTEILAEEYRKLNDNVIVLPNCVDPEDWSTPLRDEGDKVRIGLSGSIGRRNDIEHVKDVLKELSDRDDVQLVLFALPPRDHTTVERVQKLYKEEYEFWDTLNIEWQPTVKLADYMETLNDLKLDLMMIPRKEDYFNQCKSNLKFLESAMLEIPVVAQGFPDGTSPYQGVGDSQVMDIVTDNSKWIETLDILIKDKDLRREKGKRAREYVVNNYNITDNIYKWEDAYKTLFNPKS